MTARHPRPLDDTMDFLDLLGVRVGIGEFGVVYVQPPPEFDAADLVRVLLNRHDELKAKLEERAARDRCQFVGGTLNGQPVANRGIPFMYQDRACCRVIHHVRRGLWEIYLSNDWDESRDGRLFFRGRASSQHVARNKSIWLLDKMADGTSDVF